jgi:hypothetical protein
LRSKGCVPDETALSVDEGLDKTNSVNFSNHPGLDVSSFLVGWAPYTGVGAALLALLLFGAATLLVYYGRRLTTALGIKGPGRTGGILIVATWIISLAVLLLTEALLRALTAQRPSVPSPIEPVTITCGVCCFVAIAYLTRSHGLNLALGSAFVGTAAAPMIFELPFDLIVMGRGNAPAYITLIFFTPLLLVEISTLSLLQLSPLTKVTRYTAFSLATMFAIWGVWALFGFAYPADPVSFTLNSLSKVVSFATAVTLFFNETK